jgi:lipopolysaccharide export system ATP-binding protein
MTGLPWVRRLDGLAPSLLAVLAVIVRGADDRGGLALGDLLRGYRDILTSRHGDGADRPVASAFLDSLLEQVQGHVLPDLLANGWIRDTRDAAWGRIEAAEDWWSEVAQARAEAEALILDRAFPRAEAPGPMLATVEMRGASLLECEGLNKAFKRRRVVRDVSLRLVQGEVVGLLGPNGAGKTTTFYMITGLIRPDSGQIRLNGQDVTTAPMYRRARAGIGYLAQEASVFRRLTVEQNVLAILETMGLDRDERQRRLENMLDELSIKHLRKNRAYSLSGGERRRLEITRALVARPKFMLMDEPFAGIDPIAVHDIQTIVAGLKHRGIGVLITDHNVEQTLEIVDRAYIMFEGAVQASGTVQDLVFNDQVADIYLGPTLTARLRARMEQPA